MNKKFTELIELNQIDINLRIDDVINSIASQIEYVMTRPYPGTLDYDSEIIAIVEDIDLELRLSEVRVVNASEIMDNDRGILKDDFECFEEIADIEGIIRSSDRNLYNEKLSYEKWSSFVDKLKEFGKVEILHNTEKKESFDNYKFIVSLSSN